MADEHLEYHQGMPLGEMLVMCHQREGHAIIRLAALDLTVRVGAGPLEETWIVIVEKNDGEVLIRDILDREDFAANVEPLVAKNEFLLHLQSVVLAVETEKFLKEATA